MKEDTPNKVVWFFESLGYILVGIAKEILSVLIGMSLSDHIALVLVIITIGISLYVIFKILKFMLRFSWIPVIIILWEVSKHYVVQR